MKPLVRSIFLSAAALVALVVAGTAASANGPLPWAGGEPVVSEFEGRAASTLSEFARRQVAVICATPEEWAQIGAAQGWDPAEVWGLVPFDEAGQPFDWTAISPQTCLGASEWIYAPDRRAQKWCVTGTRTEYRTESRTKYRSETRTKHRMVWKRKKVNGKLKRVRVRVAYKVTVKVPYTVTEQVAHQVPVEELCKDYLPKLFAWSTLIHEGTHLAGVRDEAVTECYGMQNLGWFAFKMGIAEPQALEIVRDYWSMYYVPYGPSDPVYFSPECRDGGALDLRPETTQWPQIRWGGASARSVVGFGELTERRVENLLVTTR